MFIESQKRVIKQLTKLIEKERISHAFLFDGEKNTQKLEVAYYFAKGLLCQNLLNSKPCLECADCLRIDSQNHPNVTYIEADGLSIKKEQIKQLQKTFSVSGLENNKRIYIINNVEFLTSEAANSLLKFLEEPEEDVHAILLTDNMHQVINTVVSRCQIINFVKVDSVYTVNKYVEEGYNHESVLLASLISSPGEDIEELLEEELFQEQIDGVKYTMREFLRDSRYIVCEIPELWHKNIDGKKNNIKAVHAMLYLYRDVLNNKLNQELEYYVRSRDLVSQISECLDIKQILENLDTIFDAKKKLESNVNNKLVIDQLFMRLKGCK